jgi:hypothetical protein
MSMHAGIGIHMDTPSHCIEGDKCNEKYSVTPEDVTDFERQHGPLPKVHV